MNSKKRSQLIKSTQELLADGKTEALSYTSLVDIELHRVYKAQDFLIREAIENDFDPELESRFSEIIPRNEILKSWLERELRDIRSKEFGKRLAAAKTVDKEVRGVQFKEKSLWIRHPDTVRILCDALKDESVLEIRELLVVTLGTIYSRNLRHPRIYRCIEPYCEAPESNLARLAVIALSSFTEPEKWKVLIPLFRNCKSKKMMDALLLNLWQVPEDYKLLLVEILTDYFVRKKLTHESGRGVAHGIYRLVDEKTIGWFKAHYHETRSKSFDLALQWADVFTEKNSVMHDFIAALLAKKAKPEK